MQIELHNSYPIFCFLNKIKHKINNIRYEPEVVLKMVPEFNLFNGIIIADLNIKTCFITVVA